MELNQVIEARRSMRGYVKGACITEEELRSIVQAAQQAPSWKNSQTARYYVAVGEEAKAKVASCLPEYNRNNTVGVAAYVVTAYVHTRAGFDREGNADNELGNEWGAYDLGLNNMLFLLKAKELGYDTLVMGLRNAEALREVLSIPQTEKVFSVIGLGKGAVEMIKPKRKEVSDVLKLF